MGFNRRRHANTVPLASIATWIVVAIFTCAAGLFYVHCKNQLHANGTKIKSLESELANLITQDEAVRGKIASYSSRQALQRRLSQGDIKLIPITDDRLMRLDPVAAASSAELQSVSNRGKDP